MPQFFQLFHFLKSDVCVSLGYDGLKCEILVDLCALNPCGAVEGTTCSINTLYLGDGMYETDFLCACPEG